MVDACALLRRRSLNRPCSDCGEPRCLCLRTQQLEDRQDALERALAQETEFVFAEARARLKGSVG